MCIRDSAHITREGTLWQDRTFESESGELRDIDVEPGQTYRYRIQLERGDGTRAPASPPIVVAVPRSGVDFVEIQPPTPRLPQPDGNPR